MGQSGHILDPCHPRRSGCGLLFPKKSCHTVSLPGSSVLFQLMLWFRVWPCHLVTFSFFNSFSLWHFFCSAPLIHPLSLYLSPLFIRLHGNRILSLLLFAFLYLNQISISFSSGPRLPTPSLFLSVSRWFWGFAVKCVGGEREKVFSVQKNDNLSFFSLSSQPFEMDLLPAVSPSVSRNVFL